VEAPAPLQWVMAYRLHAASSNRDVLAADAHLTQLLPSRAVVGESNWLDLKQSAELLSNVMVPFLLTFSGIALLASALIIANVVAGTVIAGYREIGIMKSIGFTPAQIGFLLVAGTCLPAIIGSAIGLIIGTLGSQPFLQDTANALGVPLPFSWSPAIVAAVLAGVLVITALAAALPAGRAARVSARCCYHRWQCAGLKQAIEPWRGPWTATAASRVDTRRRGVLRPTPAFLHHTHRDRLRCRYRNLRGRIAQLATAGQGVH
jgi:predicted lysophospholipase L1 biosynthesis ABC-type transport system permease subunit